MGIINCPDNYTALVVRQPGNMTAEGLTPNALGEVTEITGLSWGRIDNDVANATLSFTKCPSNCGIWARDDSRWSRFDPWAYELWIYRDSEIAFMGPILFMRERPHEFSIEARDLIAWVGRREIKDYYLNTGTPSTIATSLINTFFVPALQDPDLVQHVMQLNAGGSSITVEYDRAQYNILQKWRDLVEAGLHYTTLGRNILLQDQFPDNNLYPFVLDATDILGDCEIIKDGSEFGTHVVGLGEALTFGIGPSASDLAYYGKVTYPPTKFSDVKIQAELDAVTTSFYNDIRNLRPQLVIPDNSSLATGTEIINNGYSVGLGNFVGIALQELICGLRYDVVVGEPFCSNGRYPMRLSEMRVTWNPNDGERVAVSLTRPGPL
jgi:hypothetical protein